LIWNTRSNRVAVYIETGPAGDTTPALLTSRRRRPNVASTESNTAPTPSGDARSARIAAARRPAARHSEATAAAASARSR
jgi:hypothetical protein